MEKANSELVLIAPDAARHAEQVYDLTGRVFGKGGYFQWVERSRKHWDDGMYDWPASTVGFLGTDMVTHWGVWGYAMRVGSARLRTAGIGAVATHGFQQGKGLMSRTIAAALPRMRERGYDVSILFGVPNYYHKFGYVPAWETPVYVLEKRFFADAGPPRGLRRHRPLMTPEMESLYNRKSAGLAGTAVRPTHCGLSHLTGERQVYAWPGAGGRLAGYLIVGIDDGIFRHIDSAGDPEQVVRALGAVARKAGAAEIRLPDLHWDSPLARHLRAGFCRLELRFNRSGGAMIRTLNLASCLRKLCAEFSRLLRRSDWSSWRGALRIGDAREAVTLAMGRGRVAIASAGGQATRHVLSGGERVAQLLIGTHGPDQVMEDGNMKASGDAAALARVLFPARRPTLAMWDQY
jgi:predicted N-acetyltransferase YhbS